MSKNGRGVEPHLARLRRHARALAGSQTSGDAYVSALLDILRADTTILPAMADPRIGLFKLYSQLFETTTIDVMTMPTSLWHSRDPASLSRRMRQAMLLISVERFSLEETAEIMGITADDVEALLDAAGQSLENMGGADIMIIESEPLIAMNIQQTVQEMGLRVNSMTVSHARALAILRRERPDLIIADGGSHLDMVDELYIGGRTPVVFISTFSEMILTGRSPEPVFIAGKPFGPAEIKALVFQALFFADLSRQDC